MIDDDFDFPPPEHASEEGLIAVGGRLSTSLLLKAYKKGIFPWPAEGYPNLWFCPPERGVLFFKDMHLPRSFKKILKNSPYQITHNQDFLNVIEGARSTHLEKEFQKHGKKVTWITEELKQAYFRLFQEGYAHSFEAWDEDQNLVGGIYGVLVDGVFSAESMFTRKPNSSKFCLFHLVLWLETQGHTWMDIQMLTPHMEKWGAKKIPRDEFLKLMLDTKSKHPSK